MHKSIPIRDIGKNPLSFLEERHEEFLSRIGEQPFFRFALLGANNEQEILGEIIDTNNERYLNFFKKPPRQRESGWSLYGTHVLRQTLFGFETKDDWRHFEVWRNGFFLLSIPMDDWFCWKHADYGESQSILLNPIVLFEYVYSWIDACTDFLMNIVQGQQLDKNGILYSDLRLYNCKGFKLRAGLPGTIWYQGHQETSSWEEQHLYIPIQVFSMGEKAGVITQELMVRLYNAFHFDKADVPPLIDDAGRLNQKVYGKG